ncbi:MAG: hypothetical protein ACYTFW_01020 [Planctomycetota bacterium]|jgi:hypothetical protein
MKIAQWDVPDELYNEYVKFKIFANNYLDPQYVDPSRIVPMSQVERGMRWQLCVKRMMELHREICKVIGIPYSNEFDNEFYRAFIKQTEKDAKLKG